MEQEIPLVVWTGNAKAKIDATIVVTTLRSGDITIVRVDGQTVKMATK